MAYKLNLPFISLGAFIDPSVNRVPFNPSFMPTLFSSFSDKMTFLERIINTVRYLMLSLRPSVPSFENLSERYVPEKQSISNEKIKQKSLMYIADNDMLLEFPHPVPSNVIMCGGLAATPAIQLPYKLDDFVQSSQDGIVVVSFGSIIKTLPTNTLVIVLALSFRTSNHRFFSRTKSERLVVYMAICDGLFNLTHSLEHLQIYITKNHVQPRELCMFYSFVIGEFISAQMFMVNAVSINAFSMIYLRKDIHLGKYDWKLLLYTFGIPFVVHLVSAFLGKLGPTGISCHFDAIKGADLLFFYSTMLTFVVIVVNSILYIATWIRIYKESTEIANTLGSAAQSIKCVHKSARNMSLFVAVFLIQWFPLAVYSITALLGEIPEVIMYLAISFTNIGGVLNGMVFIIIKRRKEHHK
ncbi:uncharacterized protein LOC127706548 [Mytilus californianus]|uniref:uncharacterized protein LOC127706548 n=1 Tax=Mytilus californianus TaxID=6549 RepID=UPI002245E7EB|nr:uncharacterized protein LOC127706548 [Mytilus californianus]